MDVLIGYVGIERFDNTTGLLSFIRNAHLSFTIKTGVYQTLLDQAHPAVLAEVKEGQAIFAEAPL